MTVRVFILPDGSVRVMRATHVTRLDRATSATPGLAGLASVDMDEGDLPADRASRELWRFVAGRVLGHDVFQKLQVRF